MKIVTLNGQWMLSQSGDKESIPAQVPGCVHTALLENGKIDDPYYRDNEAGMLWIGRTDWQYSRAFEVNDDLLAYDRVILRCEGLDTIATLRLNGTQFAMTENMHRIYEFDIKANLRSGENTLEIEFAAPVDYVEKMDAERGELAGWVEPMRINSAAWIRKEPCNYGWDWGPVLPTSGIWRTIELVAFNTARLSDVHILQTHSENRVDLTINLAAEIENTGDIWADVTVSLKGSVIASAENIALDGEKASAHIAISDPQLWWVAGMGEQPLYDVTVTLKTDNATLDHKTKQIGLRTLTLERNPDEWGESFYFACNGIPFFAKGANWIPASPYPAFTTAETYENFIQASVEANMNMLRVWGGGIYEEDVFYDLCDQYGIAIWQDFMFACGTYPAYDDNFMANVKQEAIDNVKRLRHHACIALWCGNNELEQGMPSAEWKASMSWADYERLFDDLLANIVADLDPETAYWPGSPHSPLGDRENWENQTCGDTHLWYVWHGKQPFEWYRDRQDRFCSEFGFQSFPEPSTINEVTIPEDRNITSYIMEHYQRSQIGNSTIIHYMLDWFRLPTSFESMAWLSQILQGMAMKYAIEHWRRNMPRTMGTLYWQLNDMWAAPSWASLDWKGNWKALHYMAKRFNAPALVSGLEDSTNNTVEIHVTSDLNEETPAQVNWTITDIEGETLSNGHFDVTVPQRGSRHFKTLDLSREVAEKTNRGVLLWLELEINGERVSDNLVLLNRPKHMALLEPIITTDIEKVSDNQYQVKLLTDVPALYTWLELPGAKFSDNFIHLRPNAPVTIDMTTDNPNDLQIKSLWNTYQ